MAKTRSSSYKKKERKIYLSFEELEVLCLPTQVVCLLIALKLTGSDTSAMKKAHTVFNIRRSKLKIVVGWVGSKTEHNKN